MPPRQIDSLLFLEPLTDALMAHMQKELKLLPFSYKIFELGAPAAVLFNKILRLGLAKTKET
jgi:hypothetical protein